MAVSASNALHYNADNGTFLKGVIGFFSVFSAAVEVSNALDSRRQPPADALARLGLNAETFPNIAR